MAIKKDNRTEMAYDSLMFYIKQYEKLTNEGKVSEQDRQELVDAFINAEKTFRNQISYCNRVIAATGIERVRLSENEKVLRRHNSEYIRTLINKIVWHERLIQKIEALAISMGIAVSEITNEPAKPQNLSEEGEYGD